MAEPVKRGRELAPAERQRRVEELRESLNEPAAAELDAAWNTEIERRLAEFDSGAVQAVSADAVFAKARKLAQ